VPKITKKALAAMRRANAPAREKTSRKAHQGLTADQITEIGRSIAEPIAKTLQDGLVEVRGSGVVTRVRPGHDYVVRNPMLQFYVDPNKRLIVGQIIKLGANGSKSTNDEKLVRLGYIEEWNKAMGPVLTCRGCGERFKDELSRGRHGNLIHEPKPDYALIGIQKAAGALRKKGGPEIKTGVGAGGLKYLSREENLELFALEEQMHRLEEVRANKEDLEAKTRNPLYLDKAQAQAGA